MCPAAIMLQPCCISCCTNHTSAVPAACNTLQLQPHQHTAATVFAARSLHSLDSTSSRGRCACETRCHGQMCRAEEPVRRKAVQSERLHNAKHNNAAVPRPVPPQTAGGPPCMPCPPDCDHQAVSLPAAAFAPQHCQVGDHTPALVASNKLQAAVAAAAAACSIPKGRPRAIAACKTSTHRDMSKLSDNHMK